MPRLMSHRMTPAFFTKSLRSGTIPMGHILNVDHFQMSEATFPPHPHAGFSAVTWMLPWSSGAFVNRDSRGDRSRIAPGGLHWTLAGSGMLHEEIPEISGALCEGLQIFVKLPKDLETTSPRTFHFEPNEVPRATFEGGQAWVLVGRLGDVESPIPAYGGVMMAHVQVNGRVVLDVPSRGQAFAVVLRGHGRIGNEVANPHEAFPIDGPTMTVEGDDLDIFIAWSHAMNGEAIFRGPFCMFQPAHLAQAAADFGAGKMGQLAPSPARWIR